MGSVAVRVFCALLCAFLLAAAWHRCSFGLDVTDEAFWVAEPWLILRGAVPFADLWSQTPATGLLIAPVEQLYLTLNGGAEGLALFLMRTAVLFRFAVCAGIWALLRRRIGDTGAGCFAAALFCCDLSRTRGLNYNVLSLALLALAGALAFAALRDGGEGRRGALKPMLAAAVMALCTLAHVTQAVNCVVFLLLFLFLPRKAAERRRCFLSYGGIGLGAALLTAGGLELAGRGRLFSGIRLILERNNYFRIGKLALGTQAVRTLNILKTRLLPWSLAFSILLLLSLVLSLLLIRRRKILLRRCLALALLGAGCVVMIAALIRGAGRDQPTAALFFTAPLMLAAVERERRRDALLLFLCFWVPCFFSWLMIALASHTAADYRYYTLTAGALLYVPMGCLALGVTPVRPEEAQPRSAWAFAPAPFLLAALSAACLLKISYSNVYRDSPIRQLDYRVETGIFRGIRTTRENGEAVTRLEETLREKTAGAESLLICDLFPMGYLMSGAPPCTPTTWDPCMYRYGFQDMELYRAYFDLTGRTPGMIVFINSEERGLSVDDEDNAFARFVHENYVCAESVGEGRYALRIFRRKEGG